MNKINISVLLFGFFMLFSCAELDELEPVNEIPSENAFDNRSSIQAAVFGVYDELQDADIVFDGWIGLANYFSDECDFTGTFPTRLEFGNFNVFPSNSTMSGVWNDFWDVINVANAAIAGISSSEAEGFDDASRNDLLGQVRFLRALTYLRLTQLWGDLPIRTQPTESVGEEINIAPSPQSEVYALIAEDLQFAMNNISSSDAPLFATATAARALRARLALYQEDWATAQQMAMAVLGDGFDLTGVSFLDDQIFTLGFTSNDGNNLNFFFGPSSLGGRYSIAPSQTLMEAFEEGDLRREKSVAMTEGGQPYGVKYPSFAAGGSGTATDPIYFIRHAEMCLIIAEAAAETGDFETANAYFNQVRARAGLPEATLTADNFVDLILQERFVEFAFEGPFRLIDARRKGKALELFGPLGYDSCDDVWPYPQREVDVNLNFNQKTDCCNC